MVMDMVETVIALLMIVNHEIKEHRIQPTMSECLRGKRVANRTASSNVEYRCIKSKAELEKNIPAPRPIIIDIRDMVDTLIALFICFPRETLI